MSQHSTQSLRLVHTIPGLASESSGPTYCVIRLAESLAEVGDQVRVATLDRGGEPPLAGLHTFPCQFGLQRLGPSPRMHHWLKTEADRGRVDLIHNHSLWMMPNVYPGWVGAKTGVPLVVSPHGTLSEWALRSGSRIKPLWWRFVQRPALRSTSLFHATSVDEVRRIRACGFHAPVALIPNGIDLPQIPHAAALQRRPVVAYLSRIHPVKGVDDLLRAWREIEKMFPEWQLEIAGHDTEPYAERMKLLARELGLRRVKFLGELRGDAKFRFLMESSLFVLPTHSENFGVAVAEALACGTPAIVTHGAPWSGLEANRAGWWIEGGVESLAGTLRAAMQCSAASLMEMGERGRSWMEREFSWRHIATMFHQTYSWVLHGGVAPGWVDQ